MAPVRPYSCVTIAVALYARKLGITLHYDPRPLTEEQATDLLEIYVRRIQASIAAAAIKDARQFSPASCEQRSVRRLCFSITKDN